jgi:hypothetical protein
MEVISRRFASSNLVFSQLKHIFEPGSIPGSSTKKVLVRAKSLGEFSSAIRMLG